ncbi:site-specific integrase [Helcococcus kunzii]|uniref:site-specific integrase n=1 Tax=Helcococcus kunzii TaxID=40091 RepID=UPI0024AE6617|nr:site-specific integrase [Helcococcus kunzii]
MPTYKDEKTGKWFVVTRYKDYNGNNKQTTKRGFKTQREAKEYERDFLLNLSNQPDMPFNILVDKYLESVKPKIRTRTYKTKVTRFKRALKYFNDKPINTITNKNVDDYINTLLLDNLATETIKNYKKELSTLFNFAIKHYNLPGNPTHNLGQIYNPNEQAKEYNIWTLEDYVQAIDKITDIDFKTLVNLLYWSGIRIGEALALKWTDIDFTNNMVKINKSYTKIDGKEIIAPTKTYNTRDIMLPDTTINQLKEFKQATYNLNNRLFNKTNENYLKRLKRLAIENNLPIITIHDLRHSHASYLLSNKINIVLISKRLGHKDVTTTLNTYSHFMPNDEIDFICNINTIIKN